jgi:hypothetical protein
VKEDQVKVSLKAIAIAAGVLWGGAILLLGLINLARPSFGLSFLQVISSVYPGFHVSRTIGDVRITPLRALIYLAVSQQQDGGFAQNFWVDGDPHWQGIQLDEVAFPILLAWQLQRENILQDFDPYPMILKAAAFLIRHGPVTQQQRWEEASGYSPSTLGNARRIYPRAIAK